MSCEAQRHGAQRGLSSGPMVTQPTCEEAHLEPTARVLFAGLLCLCEKAGTGYDATQEPRPSRPVCRLSTLLGLHSW